MDNQSLWKAVLGRIELSISKANFVTWFKDTDIVSREESTFVVRVPNGFAKEWLENKYNSVILQSLRDLGEDASRIRCVIHVPQSFSKPEKSFSQPVAQAPRSVDAVVQSSGASLQGSVTSPPAQHFSGNSAQSSGFSQQAGQSSPETNDYFRRFADTNINPRYTFDNFVPGEHNELALAACCAVTDSLGQKYNPLFIYGGVGLGKTHLLQSIGNAVLANGPDRRVLYITSERFTNTLIEAIRNQTVSDFKDFYQSIDLLIIDDVQFLSGKEKTQQEFFHIFNTLHQLNKQIVISSDRPPKAIPTLEERLQSRFEWGMITDVGRPDLETRVAILRSKSTEKGFSVPEESLRYIAENVKNNVRELEGALNRVIVSCEFMQTMPTLEYVQKALQPILYDQKNKGVHNKQVIEAVCDFYSVSLEDLVGKGRKKSVAHPRQVAMFILRTELGMSYPSIGDLFGGRDHSTVLHAYEKVSKTVKAGAKVKEEISFIKEKLYSL
ncbi:MAG: chromosomal replication initiator protein DnaA [Candidatus Moranbacteria bacterium]|nr:chromosomal replication initiator protein DnaA [Candidatus Moranbacteria bacterium]